MLATLRTCLPRQLDRLLRADGHVAAQIAVPITQRLILLYDKATLSPDQYLDREGYDASGWISGRRSFSQQSSGNGNDGTGKKAGKIKDKKQADPASSDSTGKLAAKEKRPNVAKAEHAEEGSVTEVILDESGEIVKEVAEATQKVPTEGVTELESKIAGIAGYDRATIRHNVREMTEQLVEAEKDMQNLEKNIADLESQAGMATKVAAFHSGRYGHANVTGTPRHRKFSSCITRLP